MRQRPFPALWTLSLLLAAVSPAAAQDEVTVNQQDWQDPVIQEFDANNPPNDLPAGEDADAAPFVSVTGGTFQAQPAAGGKITITSVGAVNLSGHSLIRLPDNADDTLKGHEQGHDDLNKNEYEKRASGKVQDAFRGFKGQMFMGNGATPTEQIQDAVKQASAERDKRIKRAQDAIFQQMDTLGGKYDDLTDHGTSGNTDTEAGKKEALKERDRAPGTGEQGRAPDTSLPWAGVDSTARVAYDAQTDRFLFEGDLLVNTALDPADTLLGKGALSIQPLVPIGLTENGAFHLSDTTLDILDSTNGDLLLNGFLYNVAYGPSSNPDFPGMIQGYLDVPPPFASQGVTNSVGSVFLDGLQQAAVDELSTSFWFYTDEPLFDSRGNILIDDSGTGGTARLGVLVPEPSTLLLVSSGLIPLFYARRRKG